MFKRDIKMADKNVTFSSFKKIYLRLPLSLYHGLQVRSHRKLLHPSNTREFQRDNTVSNSKMPRSSSSDALQAKKKSFHKKVFHHSPRNGYVDCHFCKTTVWAPNSTYFPFLSHPKKVYALLRDPELFLLTSCENWSYRETSR